MMMIERVRLQRKFALRATVSASERLAQIAQMMVLFELAFVALTSLLSLSLHFRIHYLFTTEFWTTEDTVSSNLSLAICNFLLLPYLIFWLQVKGSAVKDFIATALSLHFLFSLLVNLRTSVGYLLFLLAIGVVAAALGGYGAILRQQKKLIDQIQRIQGSDRKDQGMHVEECEKTQLRLVDN